MKRWTITAEPGFAITSGPQITEPVEVIEARPADELAEAAKQLDDAYEKYGDDWETERMEDSWSHVEKSVASFRAALAAYRGSE